MAAPMYESELTQAINELGLASDSLFEMRSVIQSERFELNLMNGRNVLFAANHPQDIIDWGYEDIIEICHTINNQVEVLDRQIKDDIKILRDAIKKQERASEAILDQISFKERNNHD